MAGANLISTAVFTVKIPDIDTIGYFSECSGLELTRQVYEYQEGGNNDFVHRLPGPVTYPNLLLSRGLTNEDALLKWFLATTTQQKDVILTLGDASASRTWTFADAFPVRWTGPQIGAGGTTVATESLEIAHTGLKLS